MISMNRIAPLLFTLALSLVISGPLAAKGSLPETSGGGRYIVVLEQPSLAEWHARGGDASASLEREGAGKTTPSVPRGRLDVNSAESRAYLDRLERGYEDFRQEAEARLGRKVDPVHRYRNAINGFAASLTSDEARALAAMPGVMSVRPEEIHKLETDAGPTWIGANNIWTGFGVPQSRGEGVIVGVIDSGINWEHRSFEDPAESHDHENPLGSQLGLCSDPDVLCNDKLIGVYDFVTDDENTEDVVEENNNGFDNDGHGTHVASIAVGNTSSLVFGFGATTISGVAPNANLVTYRVCYIGDPNDPDDDGCQGSAIMAAIDQAIEDGVDVINYSIGSSAYSPWIVGTTTTAFLNAVGAGIFVVTSGGNSGPGASTIGAPANAPWVMAAANSTHDRVIGTLVTDFSGGESPLPPNLVGASDTGNSGTRPIVHASDYGFALCGTTTEDAVTVSCNQTSSDSNPFAPGTFNGEIVVCDRGVYGRVEKGLNVMLAGAGGYILANTEDSLQSIVADDHCLPAAHLATADGDVLRDWLSRGTGHQARISTVGSRRNSAVADVVADSSSRGPALSPVEDVLKPNLMAPGTEILGAFAKDGDDANQYAFLGGTSMASPHVAGAAALLRAVNPDWTPSMISSALETTATNHLARDADGNPATPFEAGAGRPVLGQAVEAGLYFEVTEQEFSLANPGFGGDPGNLNLPSLADSDCRDSCTFSRTVTSMVTGNTPWSTSAVGFPEGVSVTVTPSEFTLGSGGSQQLSIEIDLSGANLIGQWVYGKVMLESVGLPDQGLTTAIYASGGSVPDQWSISSNRDSGSEVFFLNQLTRLPDLTLTAGGLTREARYSEALPQDPTADNPYDGPTGTFTVLQDVPEGSMWLHAETLASTALDLDLFVGRDTNGDGRAQESEELCTSTTPQDLELCDIFDPVPGTYWILVQNWNASNEAPDNATLVHAVVGENPELGLTATAQGMAETNENIPVRVAWNNVDALSGESLLGAVGVGTDRDNPNNIGVIPVRFSRTSIQAASTLALMDGRVQRLALRGNYSHDRIFIDVPANATSLSVLARTADLGQNEDL
jgi:subtilisin family serine protease